MEENAILSAKFVEEEHLVDGIKKDVSVLKVRFSKWLDTEKINVEVYKYNLVEKKGEPTGNSSSGDGFHFSPQQTVKSIHLAARPTAWKVKNRWTESYVKGFNAFATEEFHRIVAKAVADGVPNSLNSFDCADLALVLYVRYAAKNNLPITFTSSYTQKKYILDPSNDTHLKQTGTTPDGKAWTFEETFYSNDPQEAIEQFVEAARNHASAEGLIQKRDLVPFNFKEDKIDGKIYGLIYDNAKHVQIFIGTEPNEDRQYNFVSGTFWKKTDPEKGCVNGVWMAEEDFKKIKDRQIDKYDTGKHNRTVWYMFKEMHSSNLAYELMELNIEKKEPSLLGNPVPPEIHLPTLK